MKLEVGMYVRTKRGTFDRFITSHKNESLTWYTFEDRGNITNPENYIIKASHNIIDLIEVGDYVNGLQVYETGTFGHNGKTFCRLYGNVAPFYEEDIKSIVTKEMFANAEYKVETN